MIVLLNKMALALIVKIVISIPIVKIQLFFLLPQVTKNIKYHHLFIGVC